jgi:hypothetical protein
MNTNAEHRFRYEETWEDFRLNQLRLAEKLGGVRLVLLKCGRYGARISDSGYSTRFMLQDRWVVSGVYDRIAVALRKQGIHPDYQDAKSLRFTTRESTEKLRDLLATVPRDQRPRPKSFKAWDECLRARERAPIMLHTHERRAEAIAKLAEAQAAEPPSSLADLIWQEWDE